MWHRRDEWPPDLLTRARQMVEAGCTFDAVGFAVGRTPEGVRAKANREGWVVPPEPKQDYTEARDRMVKVKVAKVVLPRGRWNALVSGEETRLDVGPDVRVGWTVEARYRGANGPSVWWALFVVAAVRQGIATLRVPVAAEGWA